MRENYVYRDYPGTYPSDNIADLLSISNRLSKNPMSDGSSFVRFEYKTTKDDDGKEWITNIKIVSLPKAVSE